MVGKRTGAWKSGWAGRDVTGSRPFLGRWRAIPRSAPVLCLGFALSACASGNAQNDAQAAKAAAAAAPVTQELRQRMAELAAKARQQDDLPTAASLYRKAVAQEPGNLQVAIDFAEVMLEMDDLTAAEPLVMRLIKGAPSDAGVLVLAARWEMAHGRLAEAAANLAIAEAAGSPTRSMRLTRAALEDMRGEHAKARAIYRDMLDKVPNDPVVINNLAVSHMAGGEFAEAIALLAPAAASGGLNRRGWHNLALAYGLSGREADARATLVTANAASSISTNLAFYSWYRAQLARAESGSTATVTPASLVVDGGTSPAPPIPEVTVASVSDAPAAPQQSAKNGPTKSTKAAPRARTSRNPSR